MPHRYDQLNALHETLQSEKNRVYSHCVNIDVTSLQITETETLLFIFEIFNLSNANAKPPVIIH